MLLTLLGLAMGAVLVFALVGAPVLVLSWELRNRRIMPPLRVERAKHPRWYWLLILVHAVLLAFLLVVCGALVESGLVSQLSN
jgi:CDP-diglyceride synthetase